MIYSKSDGNLDRGQPIFGVINGEFDINSTPLSLNVGAANDHYKTVNSYLLPALAKSLQTTLASMHST